MKKITFKTHLQWNWFRAAMLGIGAGILIGPISNDVIKDIYIGKRYKVIMDGEIVALAKSEEAGAAAYKDARLAYNKDGIRPLSLDVTYEEVNRKEDRDKIKGMKVAEAEELTGQVLDGIAKHDKSNKVLAYTMRIDEYSITSPNMETLVDALEMTQEKYDENNAFQVVIKAPSGGNVTSYEVCIEENKEAEAQNVEAEMKENENASEEVVAEGAENTEPTSEEAKTEEAKPAEGEEVEGEQSEEAKPAEGEETEGEQSEEAKAEEADKQEESALKKEQAAEDGVKYVGFSENIQVMQTYVDASELKEEQDVIAELTAEHEEPGIYVVKPGDCLGVIAEKNNMTEEQLKELNPDVESDDNLYYDDRLNIVVPATAVSVLVKKQVTYEEKYYAETVYEDDDEMFIGESEVVQEGSEGTHIVTDLVTYENDLESERQQVTENVEVAAVAEVVKRGTKSKPTYMYPVTNWNVTSNYGYRWGRLHAGTDVGVPIGTTVRASRAGQVVTAGWVGGYGNCVMIDHGDGIWTVYGHLSEITTSVGSYVDQGDQIALSGNTGRSTGPHLHFEVRVNGSAVDATPYLEGTAN